MSSASLLRTRLLAQLARSPASRWPVRVRRGFLRGARWTLFPWTSYWRGTYEPGMQRALESVNGGDLAGWACWDVGAHFGFYSVGLARRVGPAGEVAAFEPNPESYRRLERHRRMNGLPWLKLYPAAASGEDGSAELYTYGNLSTTTTHLPYEGEPALSHAKPIGIATVRLDRLVETGELRPPRLVKIDAEGHGHRVLAGMRGVLERHRPLLILAFHCEAEVGGALALLDPLRYWWRPIGARAASARPAGGDYWFEPAGLIPS